MPKSFNLQTKLTPTLSPTLIPPKSGHNHKAIINTIKNIYLREGGIRGFYRGLLANLVGVTPEKAIKLAVNDFIRDHLSSRLGISSSNQLPLHYGMLAGGLAGFCQVIATNPMEMAKIQMQLLALRHDMHATKPSTVTVIRQLGIRGLYRGVHTTLMSKAWLADSDGFVSLTNVLLAGLVAAGISSYVATPMDVVKTRFQAGCLRGKPDYGMADIYRTTFQQEGMKGFLRGGLSRVLVVSPLFGISLLCYEAQQRLLLID